MCVYAHMNITIVYSGIKLCFISYKICLYSICLNVAVFVYCVCVWVCVCRPGMRSTPGPFSRWEKKICMRGREGGGGWSMPQHWVNFFRYTCSRIYRTHKMTSGLTNLNIWSIIFSTQSSVDITQKVTSCPRTELKRSYIC